MVDETQEPEIFTQEFLLDLARQGKDAWNEWARAHPNVEVDFTGCDFTNNPISFAGFNFLGGVIFDNAKFINANFSEALFFGLKASFKSAEFYGTESKDKIEFKKELNDFVGVVTDFSNTRFESKKVCFKDAKFCTGAVKFNNACFDKDRVGHDSELSFKQTNFGGLGVVFNHATFNSEETLFCKATFSGQHIAFKFATFESNKNSFMEARFPSPDVDLTRINFMGGGASFTCAEFNGGAVRFTGTIFNCPVSMDSVRFYQVPDFRRTNFAAHFTFFGTKFHLQNVQHQISFLKLFKEHLKPGDSKNADRFRRLKELAVTSKDHDREQYFFAQELRAKRFHETTGFALVWSYLYEGLSDFGRSVGLPLFWLVLTWFLFGITYAELSGKPGMGFNALAFSGATMVPFLGGAKGVLEETKTVLFGAKMGPKIGALSLIEGVLSAVFLFLTGLALRNRFRI